MEQRKNLTQLANEYGSDKGELVAEGHRYTYLYDLMFHPLRDRALRFLEIGLARGGPETGGSIERKVLSPSVQMWLDYFPSAHIYGFDICDFSDAEQTRFTFVRGDSGSEEDLGRLARAATDFDVILDDASHASYHQQLALRVLFPQMAAGGLYVLEDLHWQSPVFETQLPSVPKTGEFLYRYFIQGVYLENCLLSKEFMETLKGRVASFAYFPSFNRFACPVKLIVLRAAD